MKTSPIVLDGRPIPSSNSVRFAVEKVKRMEIDWRAGIIDDEFYTQIEKDTLDALRKALHLPLESRIILTSSIEEARNTAIKGLAWGAPPESNEIITIPGDPFGFSESAIWLERFGYKSIELLPGKVGGIAFPLIDKTLTEKTAVVALQSVTPEMFRWRIPEIRKLSAACEKHGGELVLDISLESTVKSIDYDVRRMSLICDGSALGAPTGVSILALRPGARFGGLISGGVNQEGFRGGRLNPADIAGLGEAAREYTEIISQRTSERSQLRQTALKELRNHLPPARLVHGEAPQPIGITFIIPGIEGEAVMKLCAQEGVFIASGSDCLRRTGKVSPILSAAGFTAEDAAGSVQIIFRDEHKVEDVRRALAVIGKVVAKLSSLN